MKIPFKWRLIWFWQGFKSFYGFETSIETIQSQISECANEMLRKEKETTNNNYEDTYSEHCNRIDAKKYMG